MNSVLRRTQAEKDPYYEDGPRPQRILLVEDDQEMRCLLAWALVEGGYQVVEAADGIEALNYLQPRFLDARMHGKLTDVDLVLSDLRMPGFSGMDILTSLRQHDQEAPFILITAFGDELTHAQAKNLKASLVIDKPFDVDQVVEVIRRILPPR